MKILKLVCLGVFIISNLAMAAVYKLDFIVEERDSDPTQATVITREGQPVTLSSEAISVKLTPELQSNEAIKIKAEIKRVNRKMEEEKVTLITRIDQAAKITAQSKDGGSFSFTVTPHLFSSQ